MKSKRILSYMTISNLCTLICCAIAGYVLVGKAAFFYVAYDELLEQAMCILAAFCLFRHFALLYHMRLKHKQKAIWLKILVVVLFSLLLGILLYAYSVAGRYVLVNHPFRDDPIRYWVFFKREWQFCSLKSIWVLTPIILMGVHLFYLFAYESKLGRQCVLDTIFLVVSSPFTVESALENETCGQDDEDTVEKYIRGIVRDELLQLVDTETNKVESLE